MMNLVKTRCGNFRWIYTRAINPAQQINSVENCRKKMGIFVTSPAKESLTKDDLGYYVDCCWVGDKEH
ncbi:hypothetical protein DMENIID0001_045160 [Sergentomyia squamirostris]